MIAPVSFTRFRMLLAVCGIALFALIFTACAEQNDAELNTDVDAADINQPEDGVSVEQRAEFEADILQQYNEMQAGVMTAQSQLDEMGDNIDAETTEAVADFNEQMDEFGVNFERMQNATAEEWDEAKSIVSSGLIELNNAFGVMQNAIANAYNDFVNAIDPDIDAEADVDLEAENESGLESTDVDFETGNEAAFGSTGDETTVEDADADLEAGNEASLESEEDRNAIE